jgi:hypothetical protein
VRSHVRALVKVVSDTVELEEPIFEMGSYQVGGQAEIADLRPFFSGKLYIGCDVRMGPGVDRIEDIENLSMADGVVGTLLVVETLEHVRNPFRALDEVKRVLTGRGVVIMSSTMNFPIHDIPRDYWRFTPAAFDLLLGGLPAKIIGTVGDPSNPHTVFAIGFKEHPREFSHLVHTMRSRLEDELNKVMREERMAAKVIRRLGQILGLMPVVARALHFALGRSTHFHLKMEALTE